MVLISCEENEQTPDYRIVGDSYVTYVDFSITDDNPPPQAMVDITMLFSNYKEDPVSSITFIEQIGDEERVILSTHDESNAPIGELVTKSFTYNVPDVPSETVVKIFVELASNKEFPQVEQLILTVE